MDLFNLSTNFATFITALATLLTVFEMTKQRRSSYKPQIELFRKDFDIIIADNKAYINNSYEANELSIPLLNVGFGAALDIDVQWNFNFDEGLKCITKYDADFKITIDNNQITIPNDSTHYLETQLKDEISCLLTSNKINDNDKLYLPSFYVKLLSLYYMSIYNKMKSNKYYDHIFEEFTELNLKITCYDIGKKKLEFVYLVKAIIDVTCTNGENENYDDGYISIIKK